MKQRIERKMLLERITLDFIIGGGLVAAAIYIGIMIGSVFGGMVAALPIRLGVTILLSSGQGEVFVKEMIEGSLLTYVGTLFFLLTLYFGFPRIGLVNSLIIATIITAITILIVFKLAGKF